MTINRQPQRMTTTNKKKPKKEKTITICVKDKQLKLNRIKAIKFNGRMGFWFYE